MKDKRRLLIMFNDCNNKNNNIYDRCLYLSIYNTYVPHYTFHGKHINPTDNHGIRDVIVSV